MTHDRPRLATSLLALASMPCRPGAPRLDADELAAHLATLSGWALDGDRDRRRPSPSRNYHETMAFVNALAWVAHREDHHPDLAVHYDRCVVDVLDARRGRRDAERRHLRREGRAPVRLSAALARGPRRRRAAAALRSSRSTAASALAVHAQGSLAADRLRRSRDGRAYARTAASSRLSRRARRSSTAPTRSRKSCSPPTRRRSRRVVAPDVAVDQELVNRWMIAAEADDCRFVLFANKRDLPAFPALRESLGAVSPRSAIRSSNARRRDDIAPAGTVARAISTPCSSASRAWASRRSSMRSSPDARRARGRGVAGAARRPPHDVVDRAVRPPVLGDDAWIVDSPGMKVFGLAHVAADALEQAFVEMRPFLGHCRFRDCRHDREPGCAVRAAVDAGRVAPFRLDLLHTLKRESVHH